MKISLVVSCGAIAGDVGRRPDDWPVMPVSDAGFPLQLVGFVNANPALDVPPRLRTPTATLLPLTFEP
jgi:hypothetical protein